MALEGLKQFERDCREAERDILARADRLHRSLSLQVLTRVVMRTPVDRGRARGNWQVTIGAMANGEIAWPDDESLSSQAAGEAIKKGQATIGGAAGFSDLYITNNLVYIEVLEFGQFVPPNPGPSKDKRKRRSGRVWVEGGFSIQAPQGMLGITLLEIEQWWSTNAERIAGGLAVSVA